MLVNDSAAISRLTSPLNLINRLNSASKTPRKNAMNLFVAPRVDKVVDKPIELKTFNPFEKPQQESKAIAVVPPKQVESFEPTIDNLVHNNDAQIKLATAHDTALDVLTRSVEMMMTKLDDVKADKLPAVITATSKVVESIRRERNEAARSGKGKEVHYHFYTPQQKKIEQYDVIEVS